jgi:hypothetical protein
LARAQTDQQRGEGAHHDQGGGGGEQRANARGRRVDSCLHVRLPLLYCRDGDRALNAWRRGRTGGGQARGQRAGVLVEAGGGGQARQPEGDVCLQPALDGGEIG